MGKQDGVMNSVGGAWVSHVTALAIGDTTALDVSLTHIAGVEVSLSNPSPNSEGRAV